MENRETPDSIADETRIFLSGEDERFQRQFARFIPAQDLKHKKGGPTLKYSDHNVRLIEAEEKIDSLQRALEDRNRQIERLTAKQQEKLNESRNNAVLKGAEVREMKARTERKQEGEGELALKLRLDDYRTALLKYYTWFNYLQKQSEVMKDLLEATGGWTEANRYKLYFSYREAMPLTISDDMVQHQLSKGSILDFKGVEDIESISDFNSSLKDASCQTDESAGDSLALSIQPQKGSELTVPSRSITDSSLAMSGDDLRFLEYREKIQRLECENQSLREIRVILRQKTHQSDLLEEQKQDLGRQLNYVKAQNLQVIEEHEKLKKHLADTFSALQISGYGADQPTNPASIADALTRLRHRNDELEHQLQSSDRSNSPSMEELKLKLAHFFKQKYQKEIGDLKAKLAQYEPLHPSDTTRIMRFQSDNPLDLAHEEHVVREAANHLSTSSSAAKRPRMETNSGEAEPALDELVKGLQQQLRQSEKSLDIQKQVALQYRDWVATLTGYQIKMTDEMCEVSSIVDPQCAFFFRKNDDGPGVGLTDGGSALEWQSLADNYIVQYHSIPAFLAAVTLSMVENE